MPTSVDAPLVRADDDAGRGTKLVRGPEDQALACEDPELVRARARAKNLFEKGGSANTTRAYRQDWRRFDQWCARHAKATLPATEATLADYVAHLVDDRRVRGPHERGGVCRRSTIKRALASIVARHRAAGLDSPITPRLREYVRRVCRATAARTREAPPLTVEHLHRLIAAMQRSGKDPVTVRDGAVLLIGWAGALRRSEIAGLDLEDVTFDGEDLRLRLRRSKTDTHGDGAVVGVPHGDSSSFCPVGALRAWLVVRGQKPGPLFLRTWWRELRESRVSEREVNAIVQRWATAAGLAPVGDVPFSAHSLRAGFITAAVLAGRPESRVMQHTRHADVRTFLRYVRAQPLARHPGAGLL